MIEKIFDYITQIFISSSDTSKKEKAYLNYGLKVIVGLLFEIFIIFVTAYYLNVFWYVISASVSFFILRIYAGGTHLPTYLSCLLSSLLIFILIGLVVKLFYPDIIFLLGWLVLTFVFSLIMINRYAPADTKLIPIKEPEQRLLLKNNSRIVLISWFLLSLIILIFFKDTQLIFAASLGIIAEVISIHPLMFKLINRFLPEHK